MPDASTLLLFIGASLALLAIPGPAVIYVVTRSLDQGRTAGIASMLGVETGTFAYALARRRRADGLIAASATAFTVVRYAGAAYLLYLGARKLLEREEPQEVLLSGRSQLFLKGMLVQLLNPKIAIFFVAFLPQFVSPRAARSPCRSSSWARSSRCSPCSATAPTSCWPEPSAAGSAAASARAAGWRRLSGGVYIGLGLTAALSGGGHSRPSHG